jgi:hypothetical protein
MTFIAWDTYPNHANFSFLRKNIIYLVFVGCMITFAYYQFGVGGISQGSNLLRILLFLIFILVGGWYINKNSKQISIELTDSKIVIEGETLEESSIFGFEIIQLEGYLEYALLTTKLYGQYKYFYKLIDDIDNPIIARNLLEVSQYSEGLASRDYIHKFLRYIRFK